MSAESQELSDRLGSWRRSFRTWRWQRPFWAGLLTLLGGLPIAYFPYANLTLGQLSIRMATTAGAGSLIIGVLLVVLGLTMWFQPLVRTFSGVAAILLALVSLVVSNIGGFVIGFLLALLGGALALSWVPPRPAAEADAPAEHDESTPNDSAGFTLQKAAAGPGADDESTNGRHRAG
ncbi:hypothetical protein GQS52_07775 [Streptomyces sp. SCUT-3]|uniref:DUF6114 domain-containing protein n=1 Tax=Streptomyces TaxID=1883 RepID=UPI000CAB0F64|nr:MULTISPECIES: DUF6114 domain-containing protein [unclassified Streptomyces]MCZ2524284.1 DUF6114 domain-containing protein [Streptomyces sp. HB2AG]PLW71890.1 hypothetical protein C0036_15475 [Streptomyces sp. DJ]QMV21697.1 hypothetical protein GQS52_07775 [Streptomyces sp. SCUT-3]